MPQTQSMHTYKFLYGFSYDKTESELCKLESKNLFENQEKNKLLFSNVKVEPSISAFIKTRLDVILNSKNYDLLIDEIKKKEIHIEGFKVEYIVINGDTTTYPERLSKLKDIGYSIEGDPDYYNPTITYALCYFDHYWYFGVLTKNNYHWKKHKQKPHSYSNSIGINIAKALVNIASGADKAKTIVDACCGAGTIMLEACFAGYNVEGCDVNWKLCKAARLNLAHYNYTAMVYRADVKDVISSYDAAIIDLPYNLLSAATDNDLLHIIRSTVVLSDRLIIVSISDIKNLIEQSGLKIIDQCLVSKKGNTKFARKIWVCEKQ